MAKEQPRPRHKKDRGITNKEKKLLLNYPKILYVSKNKKTYVCEYPEGEIGVRNMLFAICTLVQNGPATMIFAKKFCEEASLVPLKEFAEE